MLNFRLFFINYVIKTYKFKVFSIIQPIILKYLIVYIKDLKIHSILYTTESYK
jgi:hypothetical protein